VADVRGVADLAHLAVVDDVYSALHLPVDHLLYGTAHGAIEGRLIEGLITVLRKQQIHDRLRPRQAARVRRQNPIGIPVHSMSLASVGGRRRCY
jgi:hypothetical protein